MIYGVDLFMVGHSAGSDIDLPTGVDMSTLRRSNAAN